MGGDGVGITHSEVGDVSAVTITVHLAVMPLEAVTVITAVPGLIVVINPVEDTYAAFILLELHFNALL